MEFKVLKEDNINVIINVGAGVQWQDFVEWAVENRYYGLENMSWIPGAVGAAPINNIGAYGVEVSSLITDVYGIYLDTLQHIHLTNKECAFQYRNSVFKQELKDKIIITNVTFCLSKQKHYITNHKTLSNIDPTMELAEVVKIIHDVRQSKIPDPNVLSNVGSFFKNPIMHYDSLQKILNKYPNIPFYHCNNDTYKVPAAVLIEQCGLKDYRINDIGFAKTHSNVVINYGEGTGSDLYAFIDEIKRKVFDSCSILLDIEPTIL
jgi:UDP-N-acetylmuramate dehydrogenase